MEPECGNKVQYKDLRRGSLLSPDPLKNDCWLVVLIADKLQTNQGTLRTNGLYHKDWSWYFKEPEYLGAYLGCCLNPLRICIANCGVVSGSEGSTLIAVNAKQVLHNTYSIKRSKTCRENNPLLSLGNHIIPN